VGFEEGEVEVEVEVEVRHAPSSSPVAQARTHLVAGDKHAHTWLRVISGGIMASVANRY
jgi:hypothetical protein